MKPKDYSQLTWQERRTLREQYIKFQKGKCFYCKESLEKDPREDLKLLPIDWGLFPENFLKYPIHLQHDHDTDLTEGAVHALCNAVMWQYERK